METEATVGEAGSLGAATILLWTSPFGCGQLGLVLIGSSARGFLSLFLLLSGADVSFWKFT